MKTRLLTSFYITVTLILMFISRMFTTYALDALLGALAVFGAVEVARVFERQKKYNTIILAGLYPAVLYMSFVFILTNNLHWVYYFATFIAVFVLFFVLSILHTYVAKKQYERDVKKYNLEQPKHKYALFKALNTSLVLIYPSLFFGCTILLNNLGNMQLFTDLVIKRAGYSFFTVDMFFILLAILVTVITDSMAMITGMLLKGPKLAPIISPKKTISGSIGGLVGGVLSAIALYSIFATNANFVSDFAAIGNIWFVILIGFVGSVFCQIGDLFASYLKRKARVKDYGTIFPGHGGVMDRVDGLVVTSTVVFVMVILTLAAL